MRRRMLGGEAERVAWYALARLSWALGIAWIVFACVTGNGGVINRMLAWRAWIPLGRLTYGVYLVHVLVITHHFLNRDLPNYYSDDTFMVSYLGLVTASCLLALALHLLVEAPLSNLVTTLLAPRGAGRRDGGAACSEEGHSVRGGRVVSSGPRCGQITSRNSRRHDRRLNDDLTGHLESFDNNSHRRGGDQIIDGNGHGGEQMTCCSKYDDVLVTNGKEDYGEQVIYSSSGDFGGHVINNKGHNGSIVVDNNGDYGGQINNNIKGNGGHLINDNDNYGGGQDVNISDDCGGQVLYSNVNREVINKDEDCNGRGLNSNDIYGGHVTNTNEVCKGPSTDTNGGQNFHDRSNTVYDNTQSCGYPENADSVRQKDVQESYGPRKTYKQKYMVLRLNVE